MLDRIMAMVRSNLGDLISRAEDPEKMLNHAVFEMKAQLMEAKKQVVVAIADERKLKKHAEHYTREASGWEQRAMLAIKAGDDDLARAALARKAELDDLGASWTEQWRAQKQAVESLRAALGALSSKIDQAERERRILVARVARARAQLHINRTLSSIDAASPWGTLERMEQRVAQIEAEAEATLELGEAPETTLESQFRALEASTVIDDQLAELKQRMALRAAEDERKALPA